MSLCETFYTLYKYGRNCKTRRCPYVIKSRQVLKSRLSDNIILIWNQEVMSVYILRGMSTKPTILCFQAHCFCCQILPTSNAIYQCWGEDNPGSLTLAVNKSSFKRKFSRSGKSEPSSHARRGWQRSGSHSIHTDCLPWKSGVYMCVICSSANSYR